VSPLWRDRMRVFLAPERVDMARLRKGLKPKQAVRVAATCEQKPGSPAWEAPLEQFERMIEHADGVDMSITISNAFVRYVVLPAQSSIATPAELHAYAAFQMREVYGERTRTWVISVSAWDPCSGGICAAMERNFLERLTEISSQRKAKLKYVEPYFTGAFDHWYKQFNSNRAWFALLETGRLCIALLENGAWQRISNQRILHDAKDELIAVLHQEALLFSGRKEADETVYLFAPEHHEFALPEGCGWRVSSLQTESMPAPPHYPTRAEVGAGAI
jgi:hypothetical protein